MTSYKLPYTLLPQAVPTKMTFRTTTILTLAFLTFLCLALTASPLSVNTDGLLCTKLTANVLLTRPSNAMFVRTTFILLTIGFKISLPDKPLVKTLQLKAIKLFPPFRT